MTIEVLREGRVEFDVAWTRQRELAEEVRRDPARAFLMLLEHPPVFTLGRNGDPANILDARGIPVRRIDRGGDVTYHGPGQLVGYPILSIRGLGVRRYVELLRDVLIAALSALGLEARPKARCVGVWTARGKIASIGVRVARGVTMHGFALNVSNDLEPFTFINPCGVASCAMTSVSLELGRRADVAEAATLVAREFSSFERGAPCR